LAGIGARLAGRLRNQTLVSLAECNYRLYFAGQVISSAGTWVQLIAENWLIIKLGGNGVALGIATALQFTPIAVFGAYGGTWADRWDRRRLLLITQSLSGLLALAVGLLALAGGVRIWVVWLAALLLGFVNTIDNPGRQVFTAELVGRERVTNAVALNNAVSVSARAVGPAIGALLITTIGIPACFLVNAASYAAVVATLAVIQRERLHAEPARPRAKGQVREGLRHVARHPALRAGLLMVLIVGILGTNFQLLLTLYTAGALHRGAGLYGLLMACLGVGMLAGSLLAADRSRPTIGLVGLFAAGLGTGYLLVAVAPVLAAAFAGVAVMGVTGGMFLASASGVLQLHAGEGMRGRVMALYTVAFLGTAPIGGPLVGWIATAWSVRTAFAVSALSCLAAALCALPPDMRAIVRLPLGPRPDARERQAR
jgi:MFS family permease